MGSVEPFFGVAFEGILAENVATYFTDEFHIASKPFGGDCLVGAFAAGAHHELASEDRLPGRRQFCAFDGHVGVAATDDQNSLIACH